MRMYCRLIWLALLLIVAPFASAGESGSAAPAAAAGFAKLQFLNGSWQMQPAQKNLRNCNPASRIT